MGDVLTSNGFVELLPPSTLFSPGTWVEVRRSNPLHLGVICGAKDALGIADADQTLASESISLNFESSLTSTFSIGAETLGLWSAQGNLNGVRSVDFQLSNVKLLEIPDTAVIEGVGRRSARCREAIKFRLAGTNPVSMIKSALVADVRYTVKFKGDVDAEAKSAAIHVLATKLKAISTIGASNGSSLVGQQLVWGVRDDSRLARVGSGLPATGNAGAGHSILRGKGPITQVENEAQARRRFPDKVLLASVDVTPRRQETQMGCWATVYAMMRSWRDGRDLPVDRAVAELGPTYVSYLAGDTGLPGGGERQFVADAGMVAEPPMNLSLRGFVESLSDHGPLWIIVGDGINSHALLLVGIHGSGVDETHRSYEDAVFEFVDPADGAFHYRPAIEFMAEFEREAVFVVNVPGGEIPLRWQILHWP